MPGLEWPSLARATAVLLAALVLSLLHFNSSHIASRVCSICEALVGHQGDTPSDHPHHYHSRHSSSHLQASSANPLHLHHVDQFRVDSLESIRPSTVWCSSSGSRCHFQWLCLKRDTDEFIFAFDEQRSVFYPASLRFRDDSAVEYGRLSPVADHNLYGFKHPATVPYSKLATLGLSNSTFLVPGRTLIASRFKPDNLMHLLHDDILPLFATIHQLGLDDGAAAAPGQFHLFLADDWNHTLGLPIFEALLPPRSITAKTQFPLDALVCFEDAFIGLSNSTIWYQYGFVRPQGPIERTEEELIYIRSITRSFRARLVEALQLQDTCSTAETILLARRQNRRILNVAELFNHLQTRFDNLRLVILDKHSLWEAPRVRQLLQAFLCARTVIALHGSELILSLLLAPGDDKPATVFELFPYGVEPSHYTPFRTLSTILGHRYYSWRNELRQNAHFHPEDYPAEWGGLSRLPVQQRRAIEDSIDQPLPAYLCCSNPDWLYRIYQDTVVDLASFDKFLDDCEGQTHQSPSSLPNNNKSLAELFRLSDVSSLRCSWSSTAVTITWQAPWNLPLCCTAASAQYEVLIQEDVHQKEALVALVAATDTQLVLPSHHCSNTSGCNIWVKATAAATHRDHPVRYRVVGAFSRRPLLCAPP